MKKAILDAIIGAMTLGVHAGDWGEAPVDKTPIEECVDIGGSISVGYDTDFVFYGARFTTDSIWTDVNYTIETGVADLNVGFWYLDGIDDGYDELDLYVSTGLGTYLGFDASLTYVHYFFPSADPNGTNGDLTLGLGTSLGFVDFSMSVTSGLDIGNLDFWYYEAGIEKAIGPVVVGAGLAYDDGYKSYSDFSHYYVTASTTFDLNCRASVTPYITYQGAPAGWNAESDILYGGVSLSVSF